MAAKRTKHSLKAEDKSRWMGLLRCMLLARLTEERLVRLYHQGRIFGGVYTGIGQEAIGAATTLASGPDDLFGPLIRDMTVHIGRGESVLNIFRQYLGRATGPTRGRDGNVHYGNLGNGVYTMISHLGAMLPVIVGAVMARRRRGLDTVGVAYFGDGASSTGDVHEAMNFAAALDVPVIFLIENNQFAYSTPTRAQYRCKHLVDRAAGYGMEGVLTDGNDAVELYFLVGALMARMRKKPAPVLLECETMRMRGHGEHDTFEYVPPALLKEYAERDPIALARARLVDAGALTEDELATLEQVCQEEVDTAYHQAMTEPPPSPDTLMDGIYADG